MKFSRTVLLGGALALGAGCSSSSSSEETQGSSQRHDAATQTPDGSGPTGDGATGDPTPAESCVRPGDHGNDLGTGEYCTPTGHECDPFPQAPICLAKVGQNQWFCTRVGCTTDSQCGAVAYCLKTSQGSACVLERCQPKDASTTSDAAP